MAPTAHSRVALSAAAHRVAARVEPGPGAPEAGAPHPDAPPRRAL